MALNIDFTFDDKTYRHYMNGFASVMHCHHYLCLTSKMALDFGDLNAAQILNEVTEDTMRPLFDEYINTNGIAETKDKLLVGMEYYSAMGLGKMKASIDSNGGEIQLMRSHVDQGWLKKWGKHPEHVNFFTCGYIAAMFAAATNKPARSFVVTETESIVSGSSVSKFQVQQA